MDFHYRCSECSRRYDISPDLMLCPDCSLRQQSQEPLHGILEVELTGKIDDKFEVYDLLPVDRQYFPDLPIGKTPLWQPPHLNLKLAYPNLFIKDDTCNLSGSLKDRASWLVTAFAKKEGIREIVVASTGNAASSMAAVGAAAGLQVTIFIPESAPRAKLIQSLQYGARVILCVGNYDTAFDLSLDFCKQSAQILSRNTGYNPLTMEGKKTVALEIYQSLHRAPDFVFVPVGDGVIMGGIYKGFRDLHKSGLIDKIPTVVAVQAQGSNAVYQAWRKGHFRKVASHTIADSIAVDMPRNGYYTLQQLKRYQGRCITVSDDEILCAQKELSSQAGLFTEPAAAAAYAGFLKIKQIIDQQATIVILATGNGLKDVDAAAKMVEFPQKAITSLEEL